MDCSLPGSSVHGILQARILAWVAIFSSRGSSWPRNWTGVSCIARGFFTTELPETSIQRAVSHISSSSLSLGLPKPEVWPSKSSPSLKSHSDATFSLKIYQIPSSQSARLIHRITAFGSGLLHRQGSVISAWLGSTESTEQPSTMAGEILVYHIPEHLSRLWELPWTRWLSSLPLMLVPKTQSPSPPLRNIPHVPYPL